MLSEGEFKELGSEEKKGYIKSLKQGRGKWDLIYLLREVLGYREVEEGVHGGMASGMGKGGKRQLYLLPRGSFKTTVITIGGTIQRILRDGDIRILLDSEVLDYSEKLLAQIKRDMQKAKFVELYGDMISSDYRETSREFTVKTRKNLGLKEPTIYASGIGTVNIGPHYDYIIADDLHSEKNVNTKEQIEKVIGHYRLLLSLLEPDGKLIIAGTRWHFMDLYSYILEEEIPRGADWDIIIERAIREDGSLFFPNRLSREFLEDQRKAQGSYLFSVLYQNSPVDDENAVFKKSDFRYWEGDLWPVQDGKRILLNIYILIDRAFSTAIGADYTGCSCVGVSNSGSIYVLEAERHKFGLQELFNLISDWIKKYGGDRIRKVMVETINWEEVATFFEQEMRKRNFFFLKERVLPDNHKSKLARIRDALQARYENHVIFHRKGLMDLEDELIRFPTATHEDLVDSVAMIVPIMLAPGNPKDELEEMEYVGSGMFGNAGY